MSKLLNFGTFCGGVSGLLLGGLAVLQLLAPPEIRTPEDLIDALGSIEQAIRSNGLEVEDGSSEQLEASIESFNAGVVQAIRRDDGSLPFVPRTSFGVEDLPHGVPFDFVAPNGVSKLFVVNVGANNLLSITMDGESGRSTRIGDSLSASFGEMTCTFEVIAIEFLDYATIRSRCL